jgi:hypothetical protein
MAGKKLLNRWDAFLDSVRDMAARHAEHFGDTVGAIGEAKDRLQSVSREIRELSEALAPIPQSLYIEYSAKVRFLEVLNHKVDLLGNEEFWTQLNDNMDAFLMCLDEGYGPNAENDTVSLEAEEEPLAEPELRPPEVDSPEFSVKRPVEEIRSVIADSEFSRLNKYEQVAVLAGMLFGAEWFDSVECRNGIEKTLGLTGVFSLHMALQYCSVTMENPTLLLRSEASPDGRIPAVGKRPKYRYLVSDVTIRIIQRLIQSQIQPNS